MLNLLGNFVCIGYSSQSLGREVLNLLEVEGEDGAADDGDVHHVPDVPAENTVSHLNPTTLRVSHLR